jgi:hypothetical protein
MKTTGLIALLFTAAFATHVCSAFDLGGLRVGDTRAMTIAKDSSLAGKNVSGKCLPFAVALNKKFHEAGITSRIIGYSYEDAGRLAASRGHAVVAFQDGGRTYLMDNQSWTPRWMESTNTRDLAVQFEGMNTRVVTAWNASSRDLSGNENRLAGRALKR